MELCLVSAIMIVQVGFPFEIIILTIIIRVALSIVATNNCAFQVM